MARLVCFLVILPAILTTPMAQYKHNYSIATVPYCLFVQSVGMETRAQRQCFSIWSITMSLLDKVLGMITYTGINLPLAHGVKCVTNSSLFVSACKERLLSAWMDFGCCASNKIFLTHRLGLGCLESAVCNLMSYCIIPP